MKRYIATLVLTVILGISPAIAQESLTRVVLWTNQSINGPIAIYYNGQYAGSITKRYSSAPPCGAEGCVTLTVTGKHNTFYGIASNGVKWYSEKTTLRAGCTAIRLYSSGSTTSQSNTAGTSGGGYRQEVQPTPAQAAVSSTAKQFVDGWGDIMRAGMGLGADGVPFLSVDLGMSVYYGEYARVNFATPGMTGFMIFGGIGKDWIFNWKNSDKLLWHAGLGMLLNIEASHFHLGMAFGENPLCYNYGLLCEFVYHQVFGDYRPFGFVLGAGVGPGNFKAKDPDLVWDVQVGFAVKLWSR